MEYQIWTKDEFGDLWSRKDAGDKGAAKRLILEELKGGREPVLTIEVPFDLQLNVGEPGSETTKTRIKAPHPAYEKPEEEVKSEADQGKA